MRALFVVMVYESNLGFYSCSLSRVSSVRVRSIVGRSHSCGPGRPIFPWLASSVANLPEPPKVPKTGIVSRRKVKSGVPDEQVVVSCEGTQRVAKIWTGRSSCESITKLYSALSSRLKPAPGISGVLSDCLPCGPAAQ